MFEVLRRRRGLRALLTAAMTALVVGASVAQPANAAPTPNRAPSASTAPNGSTHAPVQDMCAKPAHRGQMSCLAMRRKASRGSQFNAAPSPVRGVDSSGFPPADLQAAYHLPSGSAGSGQTVAVVDAYDDPLAESDLAVYRSKYGLPSCTTANGCFRKVNQRGQTTSPDPDQGWAAEISIDLDMISAVCPNCHILLVEADNDYIDNLGQAVNRAVALGARFVSNSYGGAEDPAELNWDTKYFTHPGVAITVSSGDSGYGVSYPAASAQVTAVGGTALSNVGSWRESVWNDVFGVTASGCSAYEPKPAWQKDTGCARRTVADVAAVAAPDPGVAVYDSYSDQGWAPYGGTSVSAPIVAAAYALSGAAPKSARPSSFPYSAPAALNDVTTGDNGFCTVSYLCTAGTGYDGPTGLGTPNGVLAFSSPGTHGEITGTVTDAQTHQPIPSATVTAGGQSAPTNAGGQFAIVLPTGRYDLTVSHYGYDARTISGIRVGSSTVAKAVTLAPQATITGTVTDGSGHGWPLATHLWAYPSAPTGTVVQTDTDPKTGRYRLVVGRDATVRLTAWSQGYAFTSQQIAAGGGTVNLALTAIVDSGTCPAPGYHAASTPTLTEGFDTTSVPAGWTVTSGLNDNTVWAFNDPGHRGNRTGGSGGFAVADSQYPVADNNVDTTLTSPPVDLTSATAATLTLKTAYLPAGNWASSGTVSASLDGGQSWQIINPPFHNDPVNGVITAGIPGAGGHADVRVRFEFVASQGAYWELDDVAVAKSTCVADKGGLVAGNARDANTHQLVGGVIVTGRNATTTTSTGDVTGPIGSYVLFAPAGRQTLTATDEHYATATATAKVVANAVTQADIALPAARLTASAVSVSVGQGGTTTATVTLHNTGTAPASTTIDTESPRFTPFEQRATPIEAPVRRIPVPAGRPGFRMALPTTAATAPAAVGSSSWTTMATIPVWLYENAVAYGDGKLYSVSGLNNSIPGTFELSGAVYAYDTLTRRWDKMASVPYPVAGAVADFIDGKLYVAGGWDAQGRPTTYLQVYDPLTNRWSVGATLPAARAYSGGTVLNGRLYLVGGCDTPDCTTPATRVLAYDPKAAAWTGVVDYPNSVELPACGGIDGRLYCAGGYGADHGGAAGFGYTPGDRSWTPIPDLPLPLWGSHYATAAGQLVVADGVTGGFATNEGAAYDPRAGQWTALPNSPQPTYLGGGACGFYAVGGNIDGQVTWQLPGYGQCGTDKVSWLTAKPTSVTVPAGGSVKVPLTFHAKAVTQPGYYSAQLIVSADTPYQIAPATVVMHVTPPTNWGKLAGTVSARTCSGLRQLSGASVQVNGKLAAYPLTTDVDGRYTLWLDKANSPVTVLISKDGYQPQVRTVRINGMRTTTVDVTLQPSTPCP